MDSYSSNDFDIDAEAVGMFDAFGFDTVLTDGRKVGEACNSIFAEMVHASDTVGPDGEPWPDNREPYRTDKAKKYGTDETGYRTGQMLSVESLTGVPEIGNDEMTMVYGTDNPPSHGFDGLGFDPGEDGHISDREKAAYFQANVGRFYSLNEERENAVTKAISDAFAEHVKAHFGQNPES